MKPIFFVAGGIALALPVAWLIRNSRAVTQTSPYKVMGQDGKFEWRDYPALTLATALMSEDRGSDNAFRDLFGFITGKNAAKDKIPMTTPVLIDQTTGTRAMSFVMPEAVAKTGVPEPVGNNVRLGKMEPGRYLVMRFKGSVGDKTRNTAAEKLNAWLHEHGITAESLPIFAYYDPPWTPDFLRRNEVMVRVAPSPAAS